MKDWTFDVTLLTSISARATTRAEAEKKIRHLLSEHEANLGIMDGHPVLRELTIEGDLDLDEDA
jgi:hypothetical protein